MQFKFKILTISLLLCCVLTAWGEEIILTGVYQGKNIYVRNPLSEAKKNYCTEAVYVNEKLVLSHPAASAFEIDLSFLSLNSPVEIKIIYTAGCAPDVLNSQVITPDAHFKFLTLVVDKEMVKWITERESFSGTYFIERLEGNDWVEVGQVSSKGNSDNNFYKIRATHLTGQNMYRIKFTQPEGITLYSREVKYDAPD